MSAGVLAMAAALSACGNTAPSSTARDSTPPTTNIEATTEPTSVGLTRPAAPGVPTGAITEELAASLLLAVEELQADAFSSSAPDAIAASGDARLGWVLSDLLRFSGPDSEPPIIRAFEKITEIDMADLPSDDDSSTWELVTNQLIAWDLPAHPQYPEFKRALFEAFEPRWAPLFADPNADVDWRFLSWGGVFPDDRKLGDRGTCDRGCIPALDDPKMTSAAEGSWYPDDRIIFGVTFGTTSMAFPKNIMEIHEMVNMTIEGRRVGLPYCTLCGSAEGFFTDRVAGAAAPLVLRTSGLLSLSNKVMYDLASGSVFDTFTGRAVSGPLHDAGVVLPRLSVVVSRWDEWRAAHPDTTIVAKDGGLARAYELDPLNGRDDNGPIFPIRSTDTRLGVQRQVLGVITDDGTAVAFPVDVARNELKAGRTVELAGITVTIDAGGLRASSNGAEVPSHQAFWFAWAQFHPETKLWSPA